MDYKNKYLKYKKKYLELQKQVGGFCLLPKCKKRTQKMIESGFTNTNNGLDLNDTEFYKMIKLKTDGFSDQISFYAAKFNDNQINNMLMFKYFKFEDTTSYDYSRDENIDVYLTIERHHNYNKSDKDKLDRYKIDEIIKLKKEGLRYDEAYKRVMTRK